MTGVNRHREVGDPLSWKAWLLELATDIWNLRTKVNQMADVVAELKAEFESYKGDVDKKVATLGEKIAALQAQISVPVIDPAAVQLVLDEVKAAHAELTPPTA